MYLTAEEYNEITGRDIEEATDARLKRASMLLDARIGYHKRGSDGWKLELDDLPGNQTDAAKEWVAQMVIFLADNNDQAPSAASISLGRFSVTEHGQQEQLIPEEMNLADMILESSGLVNRAAFLRHRAKDGEVDAWKV